MSTMSTMSTWSRGPQRARTFLEVPESLERNNFSRPDLHRIFFALALNFAQVDLRKCRAFTTQF